MISTLIVEDEKNAVDLLGSIVTEYCPELELLECASSLSVGKRLIDTLKPDLVYLVIA